MPEVLVSLLEEVKVKHYAKVPKLLSDILNREYKVTTTFKGGETRAMVLMNEYLKDKKKVLEFQKPFTSPTSLTPSTTSLSPYLKFGCLSVRHFYE